MRLGHTNLKNLPFFNLYMLTLGIDDAGRGPVIGPMALAGCILDDAAAKELKKLGVKDSKQLTPKRREMLAQKVRELAKAYEVVLVSPAKIDGDGENRTKLNELEAEHMGKIINALNTGEKLRVVVDCPSRSIAKWSDFLKTQIDTLKNLDISCEHKADQNHIAVSAASILAKSAREKEMDELRTLYGDEIGSGYTSDPLTIRFLEKHITKFENEGIFRKSWETFKVIKRKNGQKTLF